jgi:hypothetical protein
MTSTSDSSASATFDLDGFEQRVRDSVRLLFGVQEPTGAVMAALDRLHADIRRMNERGLDEVPSITLVGAVGEGKSWLARAFLNPESARKERAEMSTGQNASDRTHQLVWYGPQAPVGLSAGERYLRVGSSQMLDLGCPYLLADTPGFTDPAPGAWRLSEVSVTSAPIKLLVTSLSQLRDGGVEDFAATLNGSVILPVIKFEPDQNPDGTCCDTPSQTKKDEVRAKLEKWKISSPDSAILDPCFMPMARIFGAELAETVMRQRLQFILTPLLSDPTRLRSSVQHQALNRILACNEEIAVALSPFRHRVGSALENLVRKTELLPERVFDELAGDRLNLNAIIRAHLRSDWMERTPAICFPYRSFCGIFGLTQGAWDKVFFASVGSIPSLAVAMTKAVKNFRKGHSADDRQDETSGLSTRLSELLVDELRPEIRNFEAAVRALLPEKPEDKLQRDADVRINGLQALVADASKLLRVEVDRLHPPTTTILLLALLGAGSFFYLIAGPVVSLYRTYLKAHGGAFEAAASAWSEFPQPTASMIVASLLLSVAPSILLALIGMAWCCSIRRVRWIALAFHSALDVRIRERVASGSLRIEVNDQRVEAARFLLLLSKR